MELFKSPSRKIIPFLKKSRDAWKEKHQDLKIKLRNLERKHQYALDKMKSLKSEIKELKQSKQKKNS